jgi:hypothetical protein
VGKAALKGWEQVPVPALIDNSVRLWPFQGKLESLFLPGRTFIEETYPAECYEWFSGDRFVPRPTLSHAESSAPTFCVQNKEPAYL